MTDDVDPTEPMPLDPEPLLGDDAVLAPFVEALRGPATAGELAAEAAVVDLMVVAITPPTTLKDRRIMKSRFARTAAIAAAVVLSAGGVAAAATGTNPLGPIVHFADDGPNLETAPGETTTTTSTGAPPTTSTTSTSTTSTTSTTVPAAACADDNHGEHVSAVAKFKTDDGDDNHGTAVSNAAHATGAHCADTDHHVADDTDDDASEMHGVDKHEAADGDESGSHNGGPSDHGQSNTGGKDHK